MARLPTPLLLGAAVLAALPLRGQPVERPRLALVGFSAEGVAAADAEALRARVLDEARALGAEVVPGPAGGAGCSADAACLRRTGQALAVHGLLEMRVLRFGAMLRVSLRGYDARRGELVLETSTMAAAADDPSTLDLRADLGRILDALPGPRRPAADAVDAGAPTGNDTEVANATTAELPAVPAPAAPDAATSVEPAPQGTLAPGPGAAIGVGVAAVGVGLLVLGTSGLTLEALVWLPDLERRLVAEVEHDGRTVRVLRDRDAYVAEKGTADLLWTGALVAVGVGAAALASGGLLWALASPAADEEVP